jgi:RHS repeat-associated protein
MTTLAATSDRRCWSAVRLVLVLFAALGAGAAVARAQPPEAIEYYATDALGSVRIVFTPTGQVLGRSDYLPFGETLNQSGALPRQRFTGQERDGEAGMDYFNARDLQTRTGRMNAPDPLFGDAMTSPQRWNRYAYVTNSPLTLTDPSGAGPCPPDCGFTISVDVKAPLTSWAEILSYLGFIGPSVQEFSPDYLERIANRELARQARKDARRPRTTQPGDDSNDGGTDPGPDGEPGPGDQQATVPANNTQKVVGCFLYGAAVGAVGAAVVGGAGVVAVTVGAPVAVVTGVLGGLAVVGGAAVGIDVMNQVRSGNSAGVAYAVGSIAGGVAVGAAGGGAIANGIKPGATSGWTPASWIAQRFTPGKGSIGQWLETGPTAASGGMSAALASGGAAQWAHTGCR